jgi:hypothetical protein
MSGSELTKGNAQICIRHNVLDDNRSDNLAPANGKACKKREGNCHRLLLYGDARHCAKEGSHPDGRDKNLISDVTNPRHKGTE